MGFNSAFKGLSYIRTKLSNLQWDEIQQLVFASQFSEIVLVTGMEKQCRGISYDVQD